MLQIRHRHFFIGMLSAICLPFIFSRCISDTSTITEDETSYLTDYVAPGTKWGFVNTHGEIIIEPQFDDVGSFSQGIANVNVNGKWGYIDRSGKVLIEPQFKAAWAFQDNRARVKPFGQPAQYIHPDGTPLPQDGWEANGDFSDGRASVIQGTLYGYIDTTGNLAIPIIYLKASRFNNQRAVISYEDKFGLIDIDGTTVLENRYNRIKVADNQDLVFCSDESSSFIYDIEGNEKLRLDNQKIIATDGNLIAVRNGDYMYLADIETGITLNELTYANLIYLNYSRWAGKTDSGYILLDQDGNQLQRDTFDQINRYSDGFTVFKQQNTFGFINLKGKKILELEYGLVWDYKEGFARTALTDGMIFLNKSQQLAFYPPPGTIDLRDFSEGLAPFNVEK